MAETSSQPLSVITGGAGFLGSHLIDRLLARGDEVVCVDNLFTGAKRNIEHLHEHPRFEFMRHDVTFPLYVVVDEIYNLAAQSSVMASHARPAETFESIAVVTTNLLEAIRTLSVPIRLFSAGSAEMFDATGGMPANEDTTVRPQNPYGLAKATSFWQTAQYRDTYSVAACTGILFNHESPLRPEHFVTQKIVTAACRIAAGEQDHLHLGDISVQRDWGWAPDYVVAMHKMLQLDQPEDFIIATGKTCSLEDFVREVFAALSLDWKLHVRHDQGLVRPAGNRCSRADPTRIERRLGWKAVATMPDVARRMVSAKLAGSSLGAMQRAA
jgi:GDPmannose 4,6-dehydratase